MTEPASRALRLADHVHACFAAEGTILLDLRRDTYLGLDFEQSRALAPLVQAWPGDAAERAGDQAIELARSLVERGLLRSAAAGELPSREPDTLLAVQAQLIAWDEMSAEGVGIRAVLRFAQAIVLAAALLRFRSFEFVVNRARARRKRVRDSAVQDLERMRQVLSVFYHLRPFFYAKKQRCLFDSVTLLEFMSIHGLYPHWVIGVRARPFAAHSWLQHESCVLNGTPEFVRTYHPILVV